MRTIRLEEIFDEAVLPENIQPSTDFDKVDATLEKLKLKTESKHDKACKSLRQNYREDVNTR